jgi:hypothetical protein
MPIFLPSIEQSWESYIHKLVDIAYGDYCPAPHPVSHHTTVLLNNMQTLKNTVKSKEQLFNLVAIPHPSNPNITSEILRNFTEQSLYRDARIFCLTTEYDNDVMWAHYAENNTGCVLGLKHIPELDTPFTQAKRVKYTDEPVLGSGLDYLLHGDTDDLRSKTIEALCYTKSLKWSYENEWRTITWHKMVGSNFSDFNFYKNELESITLGARMDEKNKTEIIKLIEQQYKNTKIFEMIHENGKSTRKLINNN